MPLSNTDVDITDYAKSADDLDLMDLLIGFMAGHATATKIVSAAAAAPANLGFVATGGGASLYKTAASGKYKGLTLLVVGTGLTVDANGRPDGGQVNSFQLIDLGLNVVASANLPAPVQAADLLTAAEAGSGKTHASNYKAFFDLVIPTSITSIGASGSETFQGNRKADTFVGKGGNDTFLMFKGNDFFNGGKGKDSVDGSFLNKAINANLDKGWVKYGTDKATLKNVENVTGSKKDDTIVGNSAANVLAGMKGNDKLTGKGGKDKFVFKPNQGIDVITDFQNGKDKLDLRGFKFKSKAAALKHFSEVGGKNDDICKFKSDGTTVKIKGVDLKNIDGSDIII